MNPDDAEEYTQALGQVVAGGYRQVALGVKLGVPQALEISTAQWVKNRLGGYVQMSIEDRREAVKELTTDGFTQQEAAEIIGVSQQTVSNDVTKTGKNASDEQSESAPSLPNVVDEESKAQEPQQIDEDTADELAALDEEQEQRQQVERERMGRQVTLNKWDEFTTNIKHALSYTRTFKPPLDIAPGYVTADEVRAWVLDLAETIEGW